jgi:hypothetical protein
MANEHWYILKVRSGFAPIVVQKLRKLNFEATPSDPKSMDVRKHSSADYVYCRFALENRMTVICIPGVLDILGAPEPTAINAPLASHTRRSAF